MAIGTETAKSQITFKLNPCPLDSSETILSSWLVAYHGDWSSFFYYKSALYFAKLQKHLAVLEGIEERNESQLAQLPRSGICMFVFLYTSPSIHLSKTIIDGLRGFLSTEPSLEFAEVN